MTHYFHKGQGHDQNFCGDHQVKANAVKYTIEIVI